MATASRTRPLSVRVDEELYAAFDALCVKNGTNFTHELCNFIRQQTAGAAIEHRPADEPGAGVRCAGYQEATAAIAAAATRLACGSHYGRGACLTVARQAWLLVVKAHDDYASYEDNIALICTGALSLAPERPCDDDTPLLTAFEVWAFMFANLAEGDEGW